jgi:hypothetical protein
MISLMHCGLERAKSTLSRSIRSSKTSVAIIILTSLTKMLGYFLTSMTAGIFCARPITSMIL